MTVDRGVLKLAGKLLLLAPAAALMIGVSAAVDPANVVHAPEASLAAEFRRDGEVRVPANFDERQLQRRIIEGMTAAPQGLILGSSRVLEVRGDFFPGRAVFNSGVSGATLEDDLAILEMYWGRGWKPSFVILGLDPWVLNRAHGQLRWQSVREYEERMRHRIGKENPKRMAVDAKWRQLISPAYFQASLAELRRRRKGRESAERERKILRDGSSLDPVAVRSRSVEEVRALALQARQQPYSLERFRELDPDDRRLLESLVQFLQREGVRVVFFLPPYHPELYSHLAGSRVPEAEAWFRGLAGRLGVPVVGSYDPAACGLGEADFADGLHPRERGLRPLFAGLDLGK